MSKENTKVFRATIWSVLERLSNQLVGFIIGIVLARLLTPNDYGIVGLTTIFMAISNVFVDSGFGNALIRKKNCSEEDLSTAFYFNVTIGLVVYLFLFSTSPFIAVFFDEAALSTLIRIIALTVFFNSLCVVQTAILTSQLNIRRLAIINICAQIPAGLVAIYLAYHHFGIYALAVQMVFASFMKTVLLWLFGKWKPKSFFSKESFLYLWGFGSNLLAASLIGAIFDKIYNVLIGRYIGKIELGYFSKASQLQGNVDGITTGIVAKVALPVLASHQKDKRELAEKYREIMRLLVMIISPLTAALCISSDNIIVLLWSEKWLMSAPLFRYLIIGAMFLPIAQLSLILLQVVERTDLILSLEYPKKLIYAFFIALGFYYGVAGLCVAIIAINIAAALINMLATRKIIRYSYFQQLIDLSKYMVVAFVSASMAMLIHISESNIISIITNLGTTLLSYISILAIFKDGMMYKCLILLKKRNVLS